MKVTQKNIKEGLDAYPIKVPRPAFPTYVHT